MTHRFKVDRNSQSYKLALDLASQHEKLHVQLIKQRLKIGMSQQEVADRLGRNVSWVKDFERYDYDPTLAEVRRYALVVRASVTHKVNGEDVTW